MYPEKREYFTLFVKLKKKIELLKEEKLDQLELPTIKELKDYLNAASKARDHKRFIINYLLIHFSVRNKDLDLIITDNKDVIDDENNYLYLANSYCMFIRNNYKTFKTYGQKKFPIKSTKFTRAVREFLSDSRAPAPSPSRTPPR